MAGSRITEPLVRTIRRIVANRINAKTITCDQLVVGGSEISGNGGGVVSARRTTNLDRTTNTRTADPELQVELEANSVYAFEAFLMTDESVNSYFTYDFAGPENVALRAMGITMLGNAYYSEVESPVTFVSGDYNVAITGVVVTDAAGTLSLLWGCAPGVLAVRLFKDSYLKFTKLS